MYTQPNSPFTKKGKKKKPDVKRNKKNFKLFLKEL